MSSKEANESNNNLIAVHFIDYYYNLVNSTHEKLYQLYAKDAILKHSDHLQPFKSEVADIVGTNNIRAHWSKSKIAGSKIMIQKIETTKALTDSILIVCIGELALKNEELNSDLDQMSYKFTQTFLLRPAKKNTFDVHNDILTFIPDIDTEFSDEYDEEGGETDVSTEVEEQKPAPEQAEEKRETVKETEKKVEAAPVVNSVPIASATTPVAAPKIMKEESANQVPSANIKTTSSAPESISPSVEKEREVFSPQAQSKESTPETAVEEETPAEKKTTSQEKNIEPPASAFTTSSTTPTAPTTALASSTPTPTSSNGTAASSSTTTSAASAPASIPAKPVKPMTWAGQIAAAAGPKATALASVKSATVPAPATTSATFTTGEPQSSVAAAIADAKKANGVIKKDKKKELKKDAGEEDETEDGLISLRKHKTQFLNRKGQAVYPIYIRGIEEGRITQEELVKHLELNFGKVDSCKVDRTIALVDFVDAEAQRKSIKAGTSKIKNLGIRLEPRAKKEVSLSGSAPFTVGGSGIASIGIISANKKKTRKNGKSHGSSVGVVNDSDGFKRVGKN